MMEKSLSYLNILVVILLIFITYMYKGLYCYMGTAATAPYTVQAKGRGFEFGIT